VTLVTIVVDDPRVNGMSEADAIDFIETDMTENGLRPGAGGVRLVGIALGDAHAASMKQMTKEADELLKGLDADIACGAEALKKLTEELDTEELLKGIELPKFP